ncbi:MAG: efflux RND transporter periplasmic adaptor subunit [Isosphaeraceae bacterium]
MLVLMALLWGGAAAGLWYWNDLRTQRPSFRFVSVSRGDLAATISATGTIEPEEVVDVGTQVAGEIQSFGPDPRDPEKPISYGSPVEQGSVLAQLDASLFKARLSQAQASVSKAEADVQQAETKLRQTERILERNRQLNLKGRGMVAAQDSENAQSDYETAKAALAVSQSSVAVAEANLEEASVNVGYTTIKSPVKGVILDRRVNIGQTVVSSLNAASLFLIAKDLRKMEIWASVNETDIGSIHIDQPVHFSVGAFPNETFRGRVSQVRLNASMLQSVVTYTVVVAVDNSEGTLLPYLTARLEFEVERRENTLLVPNSALRWQPRPTYVVPEEREKYAHRQGRSHAELETESSRAHGEEGTAGSLWVAEGDFVRPVSVKIGLSDGVLTEISGSGLTEGSKVVIGVAPQERSDDLTSILPHTSRHDKSKKK